MSNKERKTYRDAVFRRYQKACRAEKKVILNEFCAVCGIHRKSAIRMLRKLPSGHKRKKVGRKSFYDHPEFVKVLKKIWLASDQMCSKRLKSIIPDWLPYYEETFSPVESDVKNMLVTVSPATIDRILKKSRLRHSKGLSGTRSGTFLKHLIPIRTNHWDVTVPGFLEADTVAHCGNSLDGDFVWSLVMTDIQTGWTETRAVWNKGADNTMAGIEDIEDVLYFPIRGFDCDNGSEFLNHHLYRYFDDRNEKVAFTRSRPYRKNDNCHVEQKNWTHVRQLFGYDRFEKPELVAMMNDLYKNEWNWYQNHFCPNMKIKEKVRLGSRYKKIYHEPKTALTRVLESPEVSDYNKESLKNLHKSLNPFKLKTAIERKLKLIFKHVSVTSNVRHRI